MDPAPDADANIDLHVIGLDGSSLDFRVSELMTGLELGRLVRSQLPGKLGAKIQLHHGAEMLKASNQIWLEPLPGIPGIPGIPDTDVTLTYAIRPVLQVVSLQLWLLVPLFFEIWMHTESHNQFDTRSCH